MTNPSTATDLRSFISNPQFVGFLDQCWNASENNYTDPSTGIASSPGIQQHLLIYHVYLALLGDRPKHVERAVGLARHLAGVVREDGLLTEPEGTVSDHPANACHVADALGTFCYYCGQLGIDAAETENPRAALLRIVDHHYRVRQPEGTEGWTQQLRFELRAYYWAWRITGDEGYRKACMNLWENGVYSYRHPICRGGRFGQPSIRPDYTWNYVGGGLDSRDDAATNTHTPVYYCTEPQGFAFVYSHGLKDGVVPENTERAEFCRHYFLGLLRNLSRAGHTSSDVDGYGIHRAWFSGCLVESVPVEASGMGEKVGLSPEISGWFRWYVDRYIDFVQRQPSFSEMGLPPQLPYGHNITIEKQFSAIIGSRFYSYLARALFEFGLDKVVPVEPPPFYSYAWWHNWVRVSTPRYEASFVGTTSLCNVPMIKYCGDPNLGCIHGGSPLSTLFSGNQLLYATSTDPAGLWHVELTDVNHAEFRSCGSSFRDETAMTVKTAEGEILTRDAFTDYEPPHIGNLLTGKPAEVIWSKNLKEERIRFFVHNGYRPEGFTSEWGFSCQAGNYLRGAAFVLPVPALLSPEIQIAGEWHPLELASEGVRWPDAVRWTQGDRSVTVHLKPLGQEIEGGFRVVPVATNERSPGGENSFCPYALRQLRLEVRYCATLNRAVLSCDFSFSQTALG